MKGIIHRIAPIIAILCIALFFTSTVFVEFLGSDASIVMLKRLIVMPGLFILLPSMALTGASGVALSKLREGPLVKVKMRRMAFIAANGLLILLPAAILLERLSASGHLYGVFYLLQGLELIAGAANLTLMSLNIRDGLRLSGKLKTSYGKLR